MKARPILFNGAMVRAVLDRRKTETRRMVQEVFQSGLDYLGGAADDGIEEAGIGIRFGRCTHDDGKEGKPQWLAYCAEYPEDGVIEIGNPYGQVGDLLWVREAWRRFDASTECGCSEPCECPATGTVFYRASHEDLESRWRPSIYMPRWASRITLEITGVRVERLQDISEEDARAEGAPFELGEHERLILGAKAKYRSGFCRLWQSINGPDSWEANPWVWVIEFKPILTNVDAVLRERQEAP